MGNRLSRAAPALGVVADNQIHLDIGGGGEEAVLGDRDNEDDNHENTTDTETTCQFSTSFLHETSIKLWTMKEFSEIMAIGQIQELEFEAGDNINMKSKWVFKLEKKQDVFEMSLGLKEYDGVGPIHAAFEVLTKSPNSFEDISSVNINPINIHNHEGMKICGRRSVGSIQTLAASGALDDNSLTLHIKFKLYGEKVVQSFQQTNPNCCGTFKRKYRDEILDNLETMRMTGNNSDFIIRVKNRGNDGYVEIQAHRTVLAARSSVFKAMLDSKMLESRTGKMTIEDLSPAAVHLLMKFLYTGVVDKNWKNIPEEILAIAHIYDITLLLDFLDRNVHLACNNENALVLLDIVKEYQLPNALNEIFQYIKANVDGILKPTIEN